ARAEQLSAELFYSRALTLCSAFVQPVAGRPMPQALPEGLMRAVLASEQLSPKKKATLLSALAQALGGPDMKLEVGQRFITLVDEVPPQVAQLYKSRLATALMNIDGELPSHLAALEARLGTSSKLRKDYLSWR